MRNWTLCLGAALTFLFAGALQAALWKVIAEEVDRGDQRLGLEGQQARRAREVVALGL